MKNEGIDEPLNYGKLNLFYNMNIRQIQRDIFSDDMINLLQNDYEWEKRKEKILDELKVNKDWNVIINDNLKDMNYGKINF